MNYINYIKSKVKNSQWWYVLGRTSGGFCDVDLHFVVVILHLSVFFIHIFFSTSSLTLPWTIARFLDPFCTFSPAHRRVIRDTFILRPFHYLLTASGTVLRGHFLPTSVFYLTLLPDIFGTFPTFWHNLLLSRFHWELAVNFLKVAGLHTDPQNTDPVHLFVWFTVIHKLLYILNLYLCMLILQKFYLWWKLW